MYTVQIDDDTLTPLLDRLAASLSDLTPLMQDLGEMLVQQTKDRFTAGTSPEGLPWAPKSAATLAAYARRKDRQDPRPLFGPTGRLSSEIFYEAGPRGVEWGSALIYSAVMQFGAEAGAFGARIGRDKNGRDFMMSIPWGNIPARPFIGLSDQDVADVTAEIEDWLRSTAQ